MWGMNDDGDDYGGVLGRSLRSEAICMYYNKLPKRFFFSGLSWPSRDRVDLVLSWFVNLNAFTTKPCESRYPSELSLSVSQMVTRCSTVRLSMQCQAKGAGEGTACLARTHH